MYFEAGQHRASDDDDNRTRLKQLNYDLEGDNYDELIPNEDWDLAHVVLKDLSTPAAGGVDVVVRHQPSSADQEESGFARTHSLLKRKMIVQHLDVGGQSGVCGQVANMCTTM